MTPRIPSRRSTPVLHLPRRCGAAADAERPKVPALAALRERDSEDHGVELAVRLFAHGGSAVVARRLAAGAPGEPPRTVGIDAIVR